MNETENQMAHPVPNHIFASLILAQADLVNPKKDTQGYGYRYSSLDQILAVIKPVLAEHDLGLFQHVVGGIENDCITIKTVLIHKSGQHLIEQAQVPVTFKSNPIQDYGAALTYGKRYALLGMMNIFPEDEDTDGVGSKEKPPEKKIPPKKHGPKKQPIRDPDLVDAVDERLTSLSIADWAEATKFFPHRTVEKELKRFLALSDDEVMEKVEEWRSKAA